MTIKEKEDFIGTHLKNLPILSSGDHYNVRYIIMVSEDRKKFDLYEDTEYLNNPSYLSTNSNYVLAVNHIDLGDIPHKYLFNVDYIFNSDSSYYGCSHSLVEYSYTVKRTYFDVDSWYELIYVNGLETRDLFYYNADLDGYYIYSPYSGDPRYPSGSSSDHFCYEGKSYDDLREHYFSCVKHNVFSFNPVIRNYIECLGNRLNKCCLEYC